jgi:hypothetical protein
MDLSPFATQDNANNGVWTPIILYNKPADFDLLILGDDSDAVQQYSRKAAKKLKNIISKETKASDMEFSDEAVDELTDNNDEAVIVRIAGIRGWIRERKGSKVVKEEPAKELELGGKLLSNDKESYKHLIAKIPAVKEFVLKTARERTNFLSKPSGN